MLKKFSVLLLVFFSFWAQANLVIYPIRVQFDPNQRSTEVTLLNDSKMTYTYRLEWREKKAIEGGGYIDLMGEALKAFPTASSMIRYAPRQVTLKPGERQTIKLSLRRPANLANGEYRSHLIFKTLPPPAALRQPNEQSAGLSMKMNFITSFVIPVVVVQGQGEDNSKFESSKIHFNETSPANSIVEVKLNHNSRYSSHGDIEAYWTPQGGTERLIAKTAAFTFWPELNKTSAKLVWVGAEFAPSNGKLRIVYKGARNFQGKTFFDTATQVNRSEINMMK